LFASIERFFHKIGKAVNNNMLTPKLLQICAFLSVGPQKNLLQ
jgi:hypothetical protein